MTDNDNSPLEEMAGKMHPHGKHVVGDSYSLNPLLFPNY